MKRLFVSLGIAVLGLVLALVFVRLSLDWSDSLPYQGEVTERRYIVFMAIAFVIVLIGFVLAAMTYRWLGKKRQ